MFVGGGRVCRPFLTADPVYQQCLPSATWCLCRNLSNALSCHVAWMIVRNSRCRLYQCRSRLRVWAVWPPSRRLCAASFQKWSSSCWTTSRSGKKRPPFCRAQSLNPKAEAVHEHELGSLLLGSLLRRGLTMRVIQSMAMAFVLRVIP